MTGATALTPAPTQIKLVGVCASGKSTLLHTLRAAGFDVLPCAQEHSYVPDLWRRLHPPDLLIFLDAQPATVAHRRQTEEPVEAPSVRISMRSTALSGIVLRSTAADTPEAEDSPTQRNPSTRTRVRLAPRLRSETVVEPEPTPLPSGLKPKLPAELNLVFREEPLTARR